MLALLALLTKGSFGFCQRSLSHLTDVSSSFYIDLLLLFLAAGPLAGSSSVFPH